MVNETQKDNFGNERPTFLIGFMPKVMIYTFVVYIVK